MGFLSDFGAAAAFINPVALAANFGQTLGGIYDSEQDRRAAADQQRAQDDIYRTNSARSAYEYENNIAMQREFAQNGVRWRVEDAIAAGLHPLAALGVSTAGFSPSQSVMGGPSYNPRPPSRIGESLGNMGQNISRAMLATATASERMETALRLKNMQLQNDLLDSQVANSRYELMSRSAGPSFPSSTQLMSNPDGSLSWVPSSEFQQSVGGNIFSNTAAQIENKLVPYALNALTLGSYQGRAVPGHRLILDRYVPGDAPQDYRGSRLRYFDRETSGRY